MLNLFGYWLFQFTCTRWLSIIRTLWRLFQLRRVTRINSVLRIRYKLVTEHWCVLLLGFLIVYCYLLLEVEAPYFCVDLAKINVWEVCRHAIKPAIILSVKLGPVILNLLDPVYNCRWNHNFHEVGKRIEI